jgi:very-short-patch-repair endonuclease
MPAEQAARMTSLANAIDSLGGIATRQQLLAVGFSGTDLTRAVRTGQIRRVRQARYASPTAQADRVAAARVGGMLAGPSAAGTYGLWEGTDARLHISVGRNSSRLRTNTPPSFRNRATLTPDTSSRPIALHWIEGGAVPELGPECWRVTLADCLRQTVSWCDTETAIACLDTALGVAGCTRSQIAAFFANSTASDRLVASRCRYGSESGSESLVRQRLDALRIAYRRQVKIAGVGRVDFGLIGTRIVIEVDSWKHHGDRSAFERDRRRDAELVARGFTVIRLTYQQIMTDWAWCERMILAALAAQR